MQGVSILKLLKLTILSSLFFLSSYKILYAEMSSLGVLEVGEVSYAVGVNSDGSIIVGSADTSAGRRAFKYVDGTMTNLGTLTGGSEISTANDVSSDGSVIVGYSDSTDGKRAYKYVDGTMTSLGILAGGSSISLAYAVSSDGSVIVG